MVRTCLVCSAYFDKESDEETLSVLKKHIQKCEEKKPFKNDLNANGYETD